MLNGFGDADADRPPEEGDRAPAACASSFSPADMTQPAQIEALVKDTADAPRLARHPGQQRRHPARRADRPVPGRALGRGDRDQPVSSSFHTIKHALPLMKRAGWGRIVNIASSHGLVASADKVGLRRRQARPGRPHQGGGARDRAHQDHLQRDLPRLGADAAGAEADRRARRREARSRSRRQRTRCSAKSSRRSSSSRRSRSASSPCSSARRPRSRSAARATRSTAAGPRSKP